MKQSDMKDVINELTRLVEEDAREKEKVKSVNDRYMDFLDEAQDPVCDSRNGYAYLSTTKALSYAKELAKKHGFFIESQVDSDTIKTYLKDRENSRTINSVGPFMLNPNTDPRKVGAEITCFRRYQLMLLLGVVSRTEDDEVILDGGRPAFVSNKVAPEKAKEKEVEAAVPTQTEFKAPWNEIRVVVGTKPLEEGLKKEKQSKKKKETPEAKIEIPVPEEKKIREPQEELSKDTIEEPAVAEPSPSPTGPTLEDLKVAFEQVKEKNLIHKLSAAQLSWLTGVISGTVSAQAHELGNPYKALQEKLKGE